MAAKRKSRKPRYDAIRLRGMLEYVLRDAVTGEVVQRGKKHNIVTYAGRLWAHDKIIHTTTDGLILSAIAIGSVSTMPTTADTSLGGFGVIKVASVTTGPGLWQGAVSFNSNETWLGSTQIGEFGIYNSSATAGATLFNHAVTSPYINFGPQNSFSCTMSIVA
jgi:hypothetical protein